MGKSRAWNLLYADGSVRIATTDTRGDRAGGSWSRFLDQLGYLERIAVPMLLMSAGQDQIVDAATHGAVVARIRQAEHVTIAEARHEIVMETDDIRAQFWQAFDRFAKKIFS